MAYKLTGNPSSGTSTSAFVDIPAGLVAGDLVIVDFYTRFTDAISAPAGFTQFANIAVGTAVLRGNLVSFWYRAAGGESGSWGFSWATSALFEAVSRVYSGVVTTGSPFDAAGIATISSSTGTVTSAIVPSLTHGGGDVIGSTEARGPSGFGPPSGATERYDIGGSLGLWDIVAQPAGATGTQTITVSAGNFIRAWMGVLTLVAAVPTLTPGTPTISGSAVVGSTLTASPGTWTPAADSYAYQWTKNGTDIVGAAASTYTPSSGDVGATIAVRVTGAKTGYTSASATSASTSAVASGSLGPGTPTISGSPTVGSTLTASPGVWVPSPDSYTYQWRRGGVDISGATSTTYAPVSGDIGSTLTVRVTGTKAGYTSASATSAATGAVSATSPPIVAGNPYITGNPFTNSVLECSVSSTWSPSPDSFTYQWVRGSTDIAGQTGYSYLVQTADVGQTLRVRVTGSKSGYTSTSTLTAPVGPATYSLADVRQPVFSSRAPMTGAYIRLGSKWISTVAAGWGQPILTYRWPGGNWEARWFVPITRVTRTPELAAGKPVQVFVGGSCVWRGVMTEPNWDTGEMVAQGLVRLGEEAICFDAGGMTTSIPDVAIDQAIARGALPWRRLASVSAIAYSTGTTTDRLNYVTSLLDSYCNSAGLGWGVNSLGDVMVSADPTTPRWSIFPDAGDFGVTNAALAGRVYGRYLNAQGVLSTIATLPASGPEVGVDLATKLGPMDSAKATGIINGILAKLGAQVGYTNSIVLTADQISTFGGGKANLALVRAGHLAVFRGLRDARGSGLSTNVVLQEVVWDLDEETVQVAPKGMIGQDIGSIIEDAGGIIL